MSKKNPYWNKISVSVPEQFETATSTVLMTLPVQGLWIEPHSEQVSLHVFLPETIVVGEVLKVLMKALSTFIPKEKIELKSVSLPEEAWQKTWQQHSVPLQQIGAGLLIIPPWIRPEPQTRRKTIVLSPGMAFGTGTHATTKNCLVLLEALILLGQRGPLLDVGTGSGILAIAGVKLGLRHVRAVENDPIALKKAQDNARVNRVVSKIQFSSHFPKGRKYPLVVANLTTGSLLNLADELIACVAADGQLILSGMSEGPHALVLKRYQRQCSLQTLRVEAGWVTLQFCLSSSDFLP